MHIKPAIIDSILDSQIGTVYALLGEAALNTFEISANSWMDRIQAAISE
jgi:hypothetical protein